MKNRCKHQHTSILVVIFLGLAVGLSACGSNADKPTNEDYDEIAKGVAPLINMELKTNGNLETSTTVALGEQPVGLILVSTGGKLTGQLGNIKWDVDFECKKEDGSVCNCHGENANTAEVSTDISGSLVVNFFDLINCQASLATKSHWSLTGLQSDVIVATGQTSVSAEYEGNSSQLTFAFDLTYNMQFPKNDRSARQGKVNATVDAHRVHTGSSNNSDARFVLDLQIVVDGQHSATITLDGNVQYQFDPETGVIIRK